MRWLDHREPLPEPLRGAIIALGNFDGFHLGHQAVAGEAIAWARAEGRPAIIATFDPHPVRYFQPDAAPFTLTTLEQRQELYLAAGASAMLVLHFDAALAGTTAEDFVSQLMHRQLGVAGIVTGEDFTFGKGRAGNRQVLADLAGQNGIATRAVPPVMDRGAPISSSRIRQALRDGDPVEASRLLTRPYAVRGIVVHGDKRGRTIGYPTANLELEDYLRPHYGIYAVTGTVLAARQQLAGAANIGIRPSFDPPRELLEPFFFDFAGDLYGQEIEIAFRHFLRSEAKFDTLEALTRQMDADCAKARRLLASA